VEAVSLVEAVLEYPLVYRLWQAPFVEQKFRPIRAHNDLGAVRRVLDVGCGPGTNTAQFKACDYLGVDFNPRYVEQARRRHQRPFLVADVTAYTVLPGERYDFILLNSLLHHLDTPSARRLLSHLACLLSPGGHVHIIELVLPARPGAARWLARHDRGKFPRPLAEWRGLFTGIFDPVVFQPFPLTAFGAILWEMVYFKGRAKP
jgi:SAM-dependent methyltransferase